MEGRGGREPIIRGGKGNVPSNLKSQIPEKDKELTGKSPEKFPGKKFSLRVL